MSKAGKVVKNFKKVLAKVDHGNKVKTNIPAGMASPGPPLGPMLGQVGLNIAAFCKDFNEKTKDIKEGIPLPTRVTVNPDRSYNLVIHKPPTTFFLKQAAGVQRCAMEPEPSFLSMPTSPFSYIWKYLLIAIEKEHPLLRFSHPTGYFGGKKLPFPIFQDKTEGREVCGKITLKHLYEIAKIKSSDPVNECRSLEELCLKFVGIAHSCGIEIVRELDPDEYQEFLEYRKQVEAEQKKELLEKKEAKMLRTG